MDKRVGLYLRVSTKNGQTVDNQRQALAEAIGRRAGWIIAEEFVDPSRAREHPRGPGGLIVKRPTHDGGVPVTGKRDGTTLLCAKL